MICPECGSYQPDEIKFCGVCGEPVAPEAQVAAFLVEPQEGAVELPRRRRPLVFLWGALGILAFLALLAAMAFLLFHATRDRRTPPPVEVEKEPEVNEYATPDGSVRFNYPLLWDLEEKDAQWGQLRLVLSLTSSKQVVITSERLDPDLMLGYLDETRDYAVDLIYRDLASSRSVPSDPPPDRQKIAEEMLPLNLNGRQAYSYKAEAKVGGVQTNILYYFVISSELLYELRCSAPADIWEEALPDFMVMIGTFQV